MFCILDIGIFLDDFFIDLVVFLMSVPHDKQGLQSLLKSESIKSSKFILRFKIILAILGTFLLYVYFRIIFFL